MFNVKHDFGFIGRLFGVPRSWLSKIGAFCSSFSTRGQLLDLTVPDNPDPANAPVVLEVNEKALRAFVLANAPTPETPVIPDNILTTDDIGVSVAAKSHTHNISDVANLQSTLNGKSSTSHNHDSVYAAKNHDHNGVYQPAGNYAALTSSAPATPRTATDSSGNAQSAAVGTATTAARADHIHLLPSNLLKTDGGQTIAGKKVFTTSPQLKNTSRARSENNWISEVFAYDKNDNRVGGMLLYGDRAALMYSLTGIQSYSRISLYSDNVTISSDAESVKKTRIPLGGIELFHATPFVDFHHGNASSYTSRIIEDASGRLKLDSPNHALLSVAPITDPSASGYEELQIATVGCIVPSTPGSYTEKYPSADAADGNAQTTQWTAGGSTGFAIKQLVRVKYVTSGDTPVLYAYYRNFRYDKMGRLYQVTGEVRETVDSTSLVTWS